jgi:hypothetical protein
LFTHGVKLTELHLFQRSALGLLDDEPRVDDEGKVKDTKHQECLPAEILNSMGRDLTESKVPKPLRCCSDGDASLSDACGEDLGHVELGSVSYARS